MLSVGQSNLHFPTACPSCDHSPLEADSCAPNKALRNTMRVWLEKRKKKEETKAAAQAATPPVDVTPAGPEVQLGDASEKPVESIEEAPKAEDSLVAQDHVVVDNAGDAAERMVSVSAQPNEVGLRFPVCHTRLSMLESCEQTNKTKDQFADLRGMNTINAAHASDFRVYCTLPCC